MPAGTYRNITGNTALAYGLVAAAHRAGLPLVLGSYPITPASDILHTLSALKRFGVTTLQAEDEIAGIGAALGASFGGALGVTTTSGPGVALKAETIGLAVSLELPLVIVDVQRGGPSTGLPTKTEQADLLQAMFGRNGESPVPIVAPQLPGRLLRRRDRGGADRHDLPHAGAAALRRLPRQRLRAVAHPGRSPTCPTCAVEFATEPNARDADGQAGLPPLPARPGDPGPAVGRPRHAGPRAPDRRHREGRRHRRHLLRPRQPRPHGPAAPGQGRRHRRRPSPTSRSTTRPATPTCSCSAGARPTARSPRRPGWSATPARRSPGPTCATSTRSRPTPARCCAATTGCSSRR